MEDISKWEQENYRQIRKNQIDTNWQYAKTETEIQCKTYIQLFILFLTFGFSSIVSVLTGYISLPWSYLFIALSFNLFMFAIYFFTKVYYQIMKLRSRLIDIQLELESLK